LSQRPLSAADTYHVITFIRDGQGARLQTKNPRGGSPQKHNAAKRNMIARRRWYFHGRLPQNASNGELTTFKESVSVINITKFNDFKCLVV